MNPHESFSYDLPYQSITDFTFQELPPECYHQESISRLRRSLLEGCTVLPAQHRTTHSVEVKISQSRKAMICAMVADLSTRKVFLIDSYSILS